MMKGDIMTMITGLVAIFGVGLYVCANHGKCWHCGMFTVRRRTRWYATGLGLFVDVAKVIRKECRACGRSKDVPA